MSSNYSYDHSRHLSHSNIDQSYSDAIPLNTPFDSQSDAVARRTRNGLRSALDKYNARDVPEDDYATSRQSFGGSTRKNGDTSKRRVRFSASHVLMFTRVASRSLVRRALSCDKHVTEISFTSEFYIGPQIIDPSRPESQQIPSQARSTQQLCQLFRNIPLNDHDESVDPTKELSPELPEIPFADDDGDAGPDNDADPEYDGGDAHPTGDDDSDDVDDLPQQAAPQTRHKRRNSLDIHQLHITRMKNDRDKKRAAIQQSAPNAMQAPHGPSVLQPPIAATATPISLPERTSLAVAQSQFNMPAQETTASSISLPHTVKLPDTMSHDPLQTAGVVAGVTKSTSAVHIPSRIGQGHSQPVHTQQFPSIAPPQPQPQQQQLSRTNAEYEALTREINALKEANKKLTDANATLESDNARLTALTTQADESTKQSTSEANKLTASLAQKNREIEDLRQENNDLALSLADAKDRCGKRICRGALQAQKELKRKTDDAIALRTELDRFRTQLQQNNTGIVNIPTGLIQIPSMGAANNQSSIDTAQHDAVMKKIEQELAVVSQKLLQEQQTARTQTELYEKLRDEYQRYRLDHEKQGEIRTSSHEAALQHALQQFDELQHTHQQSMAQCDQLRDTIETLTNDNQRLHDELDRLQIQYNDADQQLSALNAKESQVQQAFQVLLLQNKQLTAGHEKLYSEHDALQERYTELNQQYQTTLREYDVLRGDHARLVKSAEAASDTANTAVEGDVSPELSQAIQQLQQDIQLKQTEYQQKAAQQTQLIGRLETQLDETKRCLAQRELQFNHISEQLKTSKNTAFDRLTELFSLYGKRQTIVYLPESIQAQPIDSKLSSIQGTSCVSNGEQDEQPLRLVSSQSTALLSLNSLATQQAHHKVIEITPQQGTSGSDHHSSTSIDSTAGPFAVTEFIRTPSDISTMQNRIYNYIEHLFHGHHVGILCFDGIPSRSSSATGTSPRQRCFLGLPDPVPESMSTSPQPSHQNPCISLLSSLFDQCKRRIDSGDPVRLQMGIYRIYDNLIFDMLHDCDPAALLPSSSPNTSSHEDSSLNTDDFLFTPDDHILGIPSQIVNTSSISSNEHDSNALTRHCISSIDIGGMVYSHDGSCQISAHKDQDLATVTGKRVRLFSLQHALGCINAAFQAHHSQSNEQQYLTPTQYIIRIDLLSEKDQNPTSLAIVDLVNIDNLFQYCQSSDSSRFHSSNSSFRPTLATIQPLSTFLSLTLTSLCSQNAAEQTTPLNIRASKLTFMLKSLFLPHSRCLHLAAFGNQSLASQEMSLLSTGILRYLHELHMGQTNLTSGIPRIHQFNRPAVDGSQPPAQLQQPQSQVFMNNQNLSANSKPLLKSDSSLEIRSAPASSAPPRPVGSRTGVAASTTGVPPTRASSTRPIGSLPNHTNSNTTMAQNGRGLNHTSSSSGPSGTSVDSKRQQQQPPRGTHSLGRSNPSSIPTTSSTGVRRPRTGISTAPSRAAPGACQPQSSLSNRSSSNGSGTRPTRQPIASRPPPQP